MKQKLPSKQQVWKYLKENYATLTFNGFAVFNFTVAILVAVAVLKGQVVFTEQFYGFIVFVMFAWFVFKFWTDLGSQLEKEKKHKSIKLLNQTKQIEQAGEKHE